jgi:hypothetical protein
MVLYMSSNDLGGANQLRHAIHHGIPGFAGDQRT